MKKILLGLLLVGLCGQARAYVDVRFEEVIGDDDTTVSASVFFDSRNQCVYVNTRADDQLIMKPQPGGTWHVTSSEATAVHVQPKNTSTWTVTSSEALAVHVQPKQTSTWFVTSSEALAVHVQPKNTSTWFVDDNLDIASGGLTSTPWTISATEKSIVLPANTTYLRVAVSPTVSCYIGIAFESGVIDGGGGTGAPVAYIGYHTDGTLNGVASSYEMRFRGLTGTAATLYLDTPNVIAVGAGTGLATVTYGSR